MKIHLNLVDFYDDISLQELIIDSDKTSTKLIPFGKSGIHIKKENRGSFTSYCGGKVTNACIQKGKNSPNAAIRKKATFAANARKWKHQNGGILIPGELLDISTLFSDIPDPTPYELKTKLLDFLIKDDVFENLRLPKQEVVDPNSIIDPNEDLGKGLNEENPLPAATTPPVLTLPLNFAIRVIDFNNALMSDDLRTLISPHMGMLAGAMGSGVYDCSDFVRKVYKHYGLKGASRSIYKQVDPIDMKSLQPGDLVFLKGTQSKLGPDIVSHIAIVTNTDKLGDGIILVALGTPGKKTGMREWNLNNEYFKTHFVGGGRPRQVQSAKFGMKFQLGGYLADVPIFNKLFHNRTLTKKDFTINEYIPEILLQPKETPVIEDIFPDLLNISFLAPVKQGNDEKEIQLNEVNYNTSKGYREFKRQMDIYFEKDPAAKKFEKVLTDIAKHESNFNPTIQNTSGAPAYGYFQFWQDGKTNNITYYSGLDINLFRHDPQALIAAAVKMARSIENSWNKEDLRLALAMGYNANALIRGAWLGGVKGVRQVLRGLGNPSDAHWYKNKRQGRSVKQAMDEQI